jgi:putative cardiolipin synthase
MTDEPSDVEIGLALGAVLDWEVEQLTSVEGVLLQQAGNDQHIDAIELAHESSLGRSAAADLLRQLERGRAVERVAGPRQKLDQFQVIPERIHDLCALTRTAAEVEEILTARTNQTAIQPLVTFPKDPSFAEASPGRFDMEHLMPALARLISRADKRIILLNPFFEAEGVTRLRDPIADAIDRGVTVTIVTRYLTDSDAHNRAILETLLTDLRRRDVAVQNLTCIDYTVWDDDVPIEQRTQNGAPPAFTLHAKLLVVDTDAVYLGSANVTDYGFDRYLETGIVLDGPAAGQYADLVEFLLQSPAATPIDL